MRFSHKIRKLLNRDAFDSARGHASEAIRILGCQSHSSTRLIARLSTSSRSGYFNPNDGVSPKKYLNLENWMHTNVKRVRDLRLKKAPPRLRILDIGCGSGYFLHIAKCLGHDVLGLDLDREPIFRETVSMLGLQTHHSSHRTVSSPAGYRSALRSDYGAHDMLQSVRRWQAVGNQGVGILSG